MALSEDIKIRPPHPEEKDRFFEIYNTGLPGVDEISPERFSKWWSQSLESGVLERLWRVVEHQGGLAGVVINLINEALRWGFIWELAILPEYRRKGVGSRLVVESEKLLQQESPNITHFALGVKTHNEKAISLYERLGYGICTLILQLRGPRWEASSNLAVESLGERHIPEMLRLTPDAYWGNYTPEIWKTLMIPESQVFLEQDGAAVGFARFFPQDDGQYTEIPFHVRPGYGPVVLDACMSLVESEQVEFWVQDIHQDILEHLYRQGFHRLQSEYLMLKSIQSG